PSLCSESDDDDDHRENKAPVPGWAQTPNLHFSLVTQSQLNPEKVFGKVQPLALEDVFQNPARAHKYHKRTSSGNWGGADRLTQEEEEEYSRMMGFQ
ncbi:inner centromere protein, partial [Hyaloraphidium curvatum]